MPTTVLGWVVGMGPLTILSFVIYAILRGHLVPRTTVEDIRKDRDNRLVEQGQIVDMWKNAALLKDEALRELVPMMERSAAGQETVLALLNAIKQVVDRRVGDRLD
jgi:hypothetical protein